MRGGKWTGTEQVTEHLKQSEKLYSKKRGSILLDFKWKNAEIAAGP